MVTFHGPIASCPIEHKHAIVLKTWWPRLLCWSAHRMTSLVICSGCICLCTYSESFSVRSCVCQRHFESSHNRAALPQFSPYLGFLMSWWIDRCYNLSQKFLWNGIFLRFMSMSSTDRKLRLFIWKIVRQRQIRPQHCRCIKHFGRGINVILLHRLCCFSPQNTILLSEDFYSEDRLVLMVVVGNLQVFSFSFWTDSLHEPKACKKEISETTFVFNEDEGLSGDFRKSHTIISQELEKTCL